MCLLLFAVNEHPDYPLVLAANRDEFYERPTATAQFWKDAPQVLGGRDQVRGGTWLGVSRDGRWAAVTSYREPGGGPFDTSRGHLVSDYLTGSQSPATYAEKAHTVGDRYAGFNLLVGNAEQVVYCSNRNADLRDLNLGTHGLSNHLLDSPWPKLTRARKRFAQVLASRAAIEVESLFGVLNSPEVAEDHLLPDTGVGLEWERLLSSAFIASAEYGTRSSTVIMVDGGGRVDFIERTYLADDTGLRRPDHFREFKHRIRIEMS